MNASISTDYVSFIVWHYQHGKCNSDHTDVSIHSGLLWKHSWSFDCFEKNLASANMAFKFCWNIWYCMVISYASLCVCPCALSVSTLFGYTVIYLTLHSTILQRVTVLFPGYQPSPYWSPYWCSYHKRGLMTTGGQIPIEKHYHSFVWLV